VNNTDTEYDLKSTAWNKSMESFVVESIQGTLLTVTFQLLRGSLIFATAFSFDAREILF